jgi:hypothetical protein
VEIIKTKKKANYFELVQQFNMIENKTLRFEYKF